VGAGRTQNAQRWTLEGMAVGRIRWMRVAAVDAGRIRWMRVAPKLCGAERGSYPMRVASGGCGSHPTPPETVLDGFSIPI